MGKGRGFLDGSWVGAGHWKDQAMKKSLEFSAPEWGEGLQKELVIDYVHVRRPQ